MANTNPTFFSDHHTPRRTDARWTILQKILGATIDGGGGGGGGSVNDSGINYCFSGASPNQIFKLVNLDTGLANRIDAAGVNGVQDLSMDTGTAC